MQKAAEMQEMRTFTCGSSSALRPTLDKTSLFFAPKLNMMIFFKIPVKTLPAETETDPRVVCSGFGASLLSSRQKSSSGWGKLL